MFAIRGRDEDAMMRRWTIVFAALILGQPALAEPIHLACHGELRVRSAGGETRESFTLTIGLDTTA
jgi:hypothetical protein